MNLLRLAGLLLSTALCAAGLAGCDNHGEGPLVLKPVGGLVADPVDAGVWFRVLGCTREQGASTDIMITRVTASPPGDDHDVDLRVAWDDRSQAVVAKHGEPPPIYRPVTSTSHTGGTVDQCSLNVAVVLAPHVQRPVRVESIEVAYEADGEPYTAHAELGAVLCPRGTHAAARARSCSRPHAG